MAGRSYTNFDLLIETTPAGFRARVLQSGAGTGSVEFALPFSEYELKYLLLQMGQRSHPAERGPRPEDGPELNAAKDFGGRLFAAVFCRDVYARLLDGLEKARAAGQGLRVLLRLPSELAGLPWEYLYNPAWNRFLALSLDTPVVRYLDVTPNLPVLTLPPPLRVLAVIAAPSDFAPLDVEREWRGLQAALEPLRARGLVTLDRLEAPTLASLRRRLRRGPAAHIFHFIGHGHFNPAHQDGRLVFCDDAGRGHLVGGQELGTILHNYPDLRLALLNACDGARTSQADLFGGVAPVLVQMGLLSVIAMQTTISDTAAPAFAEEFYAALADGYAVDAALTEARTALFSSRGSLEWGSPVLFTRTSDGRVFEWGMEKDLPVERKEGAEENTSPKSSPEKKDGPKSRPVSPLEPRKGNEEKNPPLPPLIKRKEEKRLPFEPVMVHVPAGEFWMGAREDDKEAFSNETPYHQVYLDEYWIGKYPVTVREFGQFVEQSGYRTTAENKRNEYTWRTPRGKGSRLVGKEDHPVVCVSWEDAQAYCRWLSGVSGRQYGLPTEAQWEKAARGTDGRKYPWGDAQPDKSRCNIEEWLGDTTPAGKFSRAGDSPYGCADLSGNVWEWCADWYARNYYQVSPGCNPLGPDSGEYKIVRGGSWNYGSRLARCAYRLWCSHANFGNDFGIRVFSPYDDTKFNH